MKVEVGQDVPEWVMESVRPERMRTMAAILRDPNPVHWNRKAVAAMKRLNLGERTINQGPLGLSYMVNMLHEWTGPGSIRNIFMTFPQLVLDEDRIVACGKVTDIREENGETLVDCDIWLENDRDEKPLQGRATVVLPA